MGRRQKVITKSARVQPSNRGLATSGRTTSSRFPTRSFSELGPDVSLFVQGGRRRAGGGPSKKLPVFMRFFAALRSSLSRAQTHPCVILSGGWWEGGSEGSSEAQRAIASNANARRHVLPSDSARPNRGAGSGCPKQLLYTSGLILRFTPSPSHLAQDDTKLTVFLVSVQRPCCGRAQDDTNFDCSEWPECFSAILRSWKLGFCATNATEVIHAMPVLLVLAESAAAKRPAEVDSQRATRLNERTSPLQVLLSTFRRY